MLLALFLPLNFHIDSNSPQVNDSATAESTQTSVHFELILLYTLIPALSSFGRRSNKSLYIMLSGQDAPTGLPPRQSRQPQPIVTTRLPSLDIAGLPSTTMKPIKHLGHHSSFSRPARISAGPMSRRSPQKPHPRPTLRPTEVVRRDDDWTTRPELRLKVQGLPPYINTYALWISFSRHGAVSQTEIFEDSRGLRDGFARITFR